MGSISPMTLLKSTFDIKPSLSTSNFLNRPTSVMFFFLIYSFNLPIIPLNLFSLIVSLLNKFIFGLDESFVNLKNEVWINLFRTALKSSKLIIPSASISNFCIIFSGIFISILILSK